MRYYDIPPFLTVEELTEQILLGRSSYDYSDYYRVKVRRIIDSMIDDGSLASHKAHGRPII